MSEQNEQPETPVSVENNVNVSQPANRSGKSTSEPEGQAPDFTTPKPDQGDQSAGDGAAAPDQQQAGE